MQGLSPHPPPHVLVVAEELALIPDLCHILQSCFTPQGCKSCSSTSSPALPISPRAAQCVL